MSRSMPNWDKFWQDVGIENLPWEINKPDHNLISYYNIPNIKKPKHSIDIGCGLGHNAVWLAQQGVDSTGIELVPNAIDACKKYASECDVSVDFKVMDFFKGNLPSAYYDLVFDRGCFHNLSYDEMQQFASKISRILTDDGIWMSIIGSAEGAEFHMSPPRKTISEISFNVEPYLKIVIIKGTTLELPNNNQAAAWVLIAKKR